MPPSTYSHIIFDFDETLATLQIDWSHWHAQIVPLLQKYDPSVTDASDLNMFHINILITRYGEVFRDEFVAFEQRIEQAHYHGYRVIKPSLQLLRDLHHQGKTLYLLTSNCRQVVEPILEELQIKGFFQKIVTVNDVENLKPSPAPWQLIAETESDKSQFLMIGDSASDSGFAANVGIDYLDVRDLVTAA